MQRTYYFCIGTGSSKATSKLNAFDRALLNAGCGNYNLIRISSILPSGAIFTNRIIYPEGYLLPVAYASLMATPKDSLGITLSAAIAVGIPKDASKVGVIMEYSGYVDGIVAKERAISMVRTAMSDRNITEYDVKSDFVTTLHDKDNYSCVFAYIALMNTVDLSDGLA